jgi:hypothetical protein
MRIEAHQLGTAMDLLTEGFPTQTRGFWEAGIERAMATGAQATGELPLGYFLKDKSEAVGVILTLAGPKRGDQPSMVNLSSVYVRPDHRWKVPLLMRKAVNDTSTVYTSLTAIPVMRDIMLAMGFVQLNEGLTAVCVPYAATFGRRDYAVSVWDGARADVDAATTQMLNDHVSFGCLAYIVEAPAGPVPVIFKRYAFRGVPTAQIIYSGDNRAVEASIGHISRHLLRVGRMVIFLEIEAGATAQTMPPGYAIPNRRLRFIKNGQQPGKTDFSYSELAFFDY